MTDTPAHLSRSLPTFRLFMKLLKASCKLQVSPSFPIPSSNASPSRRGPSMELLCTRPSCYATPHHVVKTAESTEFENQAAWVTLFRRVNQLLFIQTSCRPRASTLSEQRTMRTSKTLDLLLETSSGRQCVHRHTKTHARLQKVSLGRHYKCQQARTCKRRSLAKRSCLRARKYL